MKRLLTLTLIALLASGCYQRNQAPRSSKSATMSYSVRTQAELDAANKRINDYRQELLRQGFREVPDSLSRVSGVASNSIEEFVLAGQYGKLTDLQVTFWTTKQMENNQSNLSGGIDASLADEQAERDFEELYKKVSFVVTGTTE